MLFNRLPMRKYLGVVVITLSIIFLFTQLGLIFPSNSFPFPQDRGIAVTISIGGLIIGVYLVTGPLGALIATVPIIMLGGTGCGGGPPPPRKKNLGKPPEPPESLSSQSGLPQ